MRIFLGYSKLRNAKKLLVKSMLLEAFLVSRRKCKWRAHVSD